MGEFEYLSDKMARTVKTQSSRKATLGGVDIPKRGDGGSRVDHEFQEISSIIEYIQEIHGEDDERHFFHGAQALLEADPGEVKRK